MMTSIGLTLCLIFSVTCGGSAQLFSDECSGGDGIVLSGTHGIIQSPNYGDSYDNSMECLWNIISPEGTIIAVRFNEIFYIEGSNTGICWDSIVFMDAPGAREEFCGNIAPASFETESNNLTVLFETDSITTVLGFSFNWTAVDAAVIPDLVLTNLTDTSEGTISSPNYPDDYPAFTKHTWLLKGAEGKDISFTFHPTFEIEAPNGRGCIYDYISIFEGHFPQSTASRNLYSTFCGSGAPLDIAIPYQEVAVRFKSDLINSGAGFSLNYSLTDSLVCKDPVHVNISGPGTLTSPYYPLLYLADQTCEWHLNALTGKQIAISFNEPFQITTFYGSPCSFDFLQIFDGPTTESVQVFTDFCGEHTPAGFLSTGNALTIVFISDGYIGGSGFSVNYAVEDACNTLEFRCWDGTCIDESLKCDGNYDCPTDQADEAVCSVEVAEDVCGVQLIAPFYKWDYRIIGGHVARQGSWPWQGTLSYIVGDVESFICGCSLLSAEWALSAAHCIFKRYPMQLKFGDYNVSDTDEMREQIRMVDAFFVHPKYDYRTPDGYLHGYDIALVHMDRKVVMTTWVQPICLPTVDAWPKVGGIAVLTGWGKRDIYGSVSPDLLNQVRLPIVSYKRCNEAFMEAGMQFPYPENVVCMGYPRPGSSACDGDSGGPVVMLNEGHWEVVGIVSWGFQCGTIAGFPSSYTRVSSFLPYIQGYVEGGIPEILKNVQVIHGEYGTISSPNFGDPMHPFYPQNILYQWYIYAPENMRITVVFNTTFHIERAESKECKFDYLKIIDGIDTSAKEYQNRKLCGFEVPPDFESSSRGIIVEFSTDSSREELGFSFTWSTNPDCDVDEFRCWDRECISDDLVCDKSPDCTNHADEIQCKFGYSGSTECGLSEVAPKFFWYPLIVGGYDAEGGSWPWQISLQRYQGEGEYAHICGGTVIDRHLILTAAHCFKPYEEYRVLMGTTDRSLETGHEKSIEVASIISHEDFSFSVFGSLDIALLFLKESIEYTKWIKPICLPIPTESDPLPGTTCVVTGWGYIDHFGFAGAPDKLQQVQIKIRSNEDCIEDYRTIIPDAETIPRNIICAVNSDHRSNICFGDSGGPLQCLVAGTWVQYGIISFISSNCGSFTYFQRTSYFSDWIVEAKTQVCRYYELLEMDSGSIAYPIGREFYHSNTYCSWHIRGQPDRLLVIQFNYVDIEEYAYCPYDGLRIHDGNSTDDRLIFDETICLMNGTVRNLEASSNEVLIIFFSDWSEEFTGFNISWSSVPACTPAEYRCWDGDCIDEGLKCDHSQNCDDGSDEMECKKEEGVCGVQKFAPTFLWPQRIIGGGIAEKGSWPWQVYLSDAESATGIFCGGTLVHSEWVLTAAHCLITEDTTYVGYGASNIFEAKYMKVEEYFINENYNDSAIERGYDIALLKLEGSIVFDNYTQPACLAPIGYSGDLHVGEICAVTGWGYTSENGNIENDLRQARVQILTQSRCEKASIGEYFPDRLFCGGNWYQGGVDTCQVDSGGPLMCYRQGTWHQFGITSFGYGCAQPKSPGIYTTVTVFLDWIDTITAGAITTHTSAVTTTKVYTQSTAIHDITSNVYTQPTATTSNVYTQPNATTSNVYTQPTATTPAVADTNSAATETASTARIHSIATQTQADATKSFSTNVAPADTFVFLLSAILTSIIMMD